MTSVKPSLLENQFISIAANPKLVDDGLINSLPKQEAKHDSIDAQHYNGLL
jgi:hypothetical protein